MLRDEPALFLDDFFPEGNAKKSSCFLYLFSTSISCSIWCCWFLMRDSASSSAFSSSLSPMTTSPLLDLPRDREEAAWSGLMETLSGMPDFDSPASWAITTSSMSIGASLLFFTALMALRIFLEPNIRSSHFGCHAKTSATNTTQ